MNSARMLNSSWKNTFQFRVRYQEIVSLVSVPMQYAPSILGPGCRGMKLKNRKKYSSAQFSNVLLLPVVISMHVL